MNAGFRSTCAVGSVTVAAIAASFSGLAVGRPDVAAAVAGAAFVIWFGFVGVRLAR